MPFKKGQSGNPYGRPKKYDAPRMSSAIKRVENLRKIDYLQTVVERSLEPGNEALMAKVIGCVVPTLKAVEVKTNGNTAQAIFNIQLNQPTGAPVMGSIVSQVPEKIIDENRDARKPAVNRVLGIKLPGGRV